jgi:hypothetical protein
VLLRLKGADPKSAPFRPEQVLGLNGFPGFEQE